MASLRSLPWRHRGKLGIGIVYLASLAFLWWRLPPAPRFVISSDLNSRVLGVSPDGALLALARDGQLQLWSLVTGRKTDGWAVPDLSVEHLVFTPDGKRLVTNNFGRDGTSPHVARIYRVGSAELEAELPLKESADFRQYRREPRSLLLSPDGQSLAYLGRKEGPDSARDDLFVKVWDTSQAREKVVLGDPEVHGWSPPLAFSSDGRFLAVGDEPAQKGVLPRVRIWEMATGRPAHTLTLPRMIPEVAEYNHGCVALAFAHDRRSLIGFVSSSSAGARPTLLRWDLATGTLRDSLDWQRDWHSPGASVALHLAREDRQILIQGLEGLQTADLCDLAGPGLRMQKEFLLSPPLLNRRGTHLAMAPPSLGSGPFGLRMPGEVIEPSRVLLLDVSNAKDEKEVCRCSSLDSGVLHPLAFSADDRYLAVNVHYWLLGEPWYKPALKWLLDADNGVHIFEVASSRRVARLPGTPGTEVIFAPGSRSLITCVPAFYPMATGPNGKPLIPEGDFPIRVYDDSPRPPVLAILSWSLLPTAGVILLGVLLRLARSWRRRGRTPDGASAGSIGPDRGPIVENSPVA